ncbi:putative mediator complex subunit 30 [Heterostelium album PN500]|uniref:Putative mediator complex subunit 30 n=1 Tax=Heterostelium pallidum (strain ATCC 26659 / Pp 5 / PN500) TaxID=670386 RepID=D3BPS5_HETP5|nr:putative mediator complex subunit 30 [Heterostelium album PN500]EFA76208.1 putative mediator complex subunit 30 [Heterostelium album PN500]|eukprot:XP_020428341.1 putative mediator complex subunit 30 [Heterostelium album PN500]
MESSNSGSSTTNTTISSTTTTTTNINTTTTANINSNSNVLSDEEILCSLAEKGENLIQFLLITVHSITKHLHSLQWDPIFLHSIISSTPSMISGGGAAGNAANGSLSGSGGGMINGNGGLDSSSGGLQGVDDQQLVMNMDTSIFHKDNEKMKLLNTQCLEYIEKLQNIIVEIVNIESKLEQTTTSSSSTTKTSDNDNVEESTATTTTNTQDEEMKDISSTSSSSTASSKQKLEELKLIAYKKNCIIKKLIDNMRLLQLSINTLNRTSLDQ